MGNYTMNTPALKAVTIDASNIKARSFKIIDSDGNVKDISSSLTYLSKPIKYQDKRFDYTTTNDLVGYSIQTIETEESKTIQHNSQFIYDFHGADSPRNEVEFISDGVAFINTNKDDTSATETIYDFYCYIDSKNLRGGDARWIVKTIAKEQPTNYDNLVVLSGYEDQEQVESATTCIDLELDNVMLLGYNSLANIKNDKGIKLHIQAPKLRYMYDSIKDSDFYKVSGDLISLVEGPKAFSSKQPDGLLEVFECTLPSLMDGFGMFENQNLQTFRSSLQFLIQGVDMFKNTNLTLESLFNISTSVPTIEHDKHYVQIYEYPSFVDNTTNDYIFEPREWISHSTGEITISWNDPSVFDDEQLYRIINEEFLRMNLKGWTIDSNVGLPGQSSDNLYAKVDVTAEGYATHKDSSGNPVILRTAKFVYGPKSEQWTQVSSKEEAITTFNLTTI